MNQNPVTQTRSWQEKLAGGLFWGWNILFLAFMLLGFAPIQLPEVFRGVSDGTIPLILLVFCLILILIPALSVLVGVLFLRKQPFKLFAWGYVVEWPLLLVLMFRFYFIREGNMAITVLLIWLAIAELIFIWHLLDRKIDQHQPAWGYLRLAGLTLLFAGTIYAAIWLMFYVVPLIVMWYEGLKSIILNFGNFFQNNQGPWYNLPLAILGQVVMFFSGALLMIMPVAGPVVAGRAWRRSLRASFETRGRPLSLASAVLPLALTLVLLGLGMAQPQHEAFQLLETPPTTPQQAQVLQARENQIRSGLLNAYLAPFRYMVNPGELRDISSMYLWTLRLDKTQAWWVNRAYEVVIQPLIYLPVHPATVDTPTSQAINIESQEAATLYEHYFDKTIVQGEREQIVEAVRYNPDPSQAELAWQAVDDRQVHLNQQEINLSEHGDWAEVELHEVYENRTDQRQEVVYYFNLPESAVITGLWLGNTSDRSKAFAYQVAPRGSAQAVYRNEIRYNRDPALVEQIGPRQYRLRAFPLEPRQWWGQNYKPGPELHLWMTYRTLVVDNAWLLPQLAEKRNIFWDPATTRLINGSPWERTDSNWLPRGLPSEAAPASHRVDFPNGQSVIVRPSSAVQAAALPATLNLAVVLDRSFSMRDHASEVKQTLQNLKQIAGTGASADLYLTASPYRGESASKVGLASLSPDTIYYFGGQNAAQLLAQFEQLQAGNKYDAILVLTDGSGYELGEGNLKIQVPDAPVWLIHLGGGLPLGYDDPTQQAIQASGGGIADTLEEALTRWAASRNAPGQYDVVDGYVWQTLPTTQLSSAGITLPATQKSSADETGFAPLAARRLILSEMAQNHGSLDHLPILDQLNQLAVQQSIVTPYSSMLVLVNESQQNLLDRLNEQADRYQREVETIGETSRADPFAVSGVPEPEEWLLLILAALLLGYAVWRRKTQKTVTLL